MQAAAHEHKLYPALHLLLSCSTGPALKAQVSAARLPKTHHNSNQTHLPKLAGAAQVTQPLAGQQGQQRGVVGSQVCREVGGCCVTLRLEGSGAVGDGDVAVNVPGALTQLRDACAVAVAVAVAGHEAVRNVSVGQVLYFACPLPPRQPTKSPTLSNSD